MPQRGEDGILLEFHRIGAVVKVSAIDPVTNTEVVVQGPASASQEQLSRTAIAKLRYVLGKKQSGGQ
jgi:hypothetical protein